MSGDPNHWLYLHMDNANISCAKVIECSLHVDHSGMLAKLDQANGDLSELIYKETWSPSSEGSAGAPWSLVGLPLASYVATRQALPTYSSKSLYISSSRGKKWSWAWLDGYFLLPPAGFLRQCWRQPQIEDQDHPLIPGIVLWALSRLSHAFSRLMFSPREHCSLKFSGRAGSWNQAH